MCEHFILESSSIMGKYFDRLGYCGICRKLAFQDGNFGARQDFNKNHVFKQAGPDTL